MNKEWKIKKLGDVLTVQNGYAFDSKKFVTGEGIPLVRIRDLKSGVKTVVNFAGNYDKKYEVHKGDLLIGMDGEFNCYNWKGEVALLNQRVCRLQEFSSSISSQFLFYGINKHLKDIEDVTGYATVKHISSGQIKNIRFALPPLPEQTRIVKILDETFAAIDKAKANAEKNLQNSRELFDSYLNKVFAPSASSGQRNPGEDWEEKKLGECFKLKSGDGLTSKNMSREGNIPVYGGNGIAGSHNEYNLSGSNVIVGRVGALCGNARHINENIWLTDNAFKVINFKYEFDNSFLTYLLNYKNLKSYARQAAQPVISNSSLQDVKLYFPHFINEQKQIVKKLDGISSESKKLEAIYQQKLSDLEELKKSILQKAFDGELTIENE